MSTTFSIYEPGTVRVFDDPLRVIGIWVEGALESWTGSGGGGGELVATAGLADDAVLEPTELRAVTVNE
jgi:hypothetical protein